MTTAGSPKQTALEAIQRLPDDASYEDIMYELYFREAVDEGLKQAAKGQLTPRSEVMREMLEWLKSGSRPARA